MDNVRRVLLLEGVPTDTTPIATRVGRAVRAAVEMLGTRRIAHARTRLRRHAAGRSRAHASAIIDVFQQGYVSACRSGDIASLVTDLSRVHPQLQGFAFEGSAMALALIDLLPRHRGPGLAEFLSAARHQRYVIHVGAGWAFAQLGRVEGARFRGLDPLLRWLAVDGVGFHDGFMRAAASAASPARRARLSVYGRRAFDQGLGRSLWFTATADAGTIAAAIHAEAEERQPDLWSGVGLACAYAGGVDDQSIRALTVASGRSRWHMAQGASFAAEAHERAGWIPPHTERASQLICGMSATETAQIARRSRVGVADERSAPAYEIWRTRIRAQLCDHATFYGGE